ncbi:MAG: S1 RNA-binding domain-containing protein [Deltaproteobacteria bacterium]|nr:S1 RNA-binding domain-containing protein [Deltaproteobacteria bacterium]
MAGLVEALSAQGVSVEMVREAGLMKQARKACQGQKHSPHLKLAAARVVAGRLRDPLSGYAGLEPDELGLGEYLDRVDASRLHAALADARDVAVWQREHGRAQGPAARGVAANPMVRKLADIVPGMELVGVVANLTGFGAFVDVGLESQGLVHVSEMSDETFVSHPSEVLQVGQRVRVRVLELDMARERLSLSMRGARNETRRKGRERRLQSLRALDELFKK